LSLYWAKISAQLPNKTYDSVYTVFESLIHNNTRNIVVSFTNRNIYLAGEKIWFRAYVIDDGSADLDTKSNNLFADFVNEKDCIIEQLVLNNKNLQTNGVFNIPEFLPTGFYWIRFYTISQLQNNYQGLSLHHVFILNRQLHDKDRYLKQFEKSFASNQLNLSIQFFPERLTASPGIISTGVVQIRDRYNNPLSVKGDLVNQQDSEVTSFKTNNLGLARLKFLNDSKKRYALIFHLNSQMVRYQLPEVNKSSIQLSVAIQTDSVIKTFVTLEDSVPINSHTTLLAVKGKKLYYAAVGNGNYAVDIPIQKLPGGIVRLLLFNDDKKLIAERKIYIPKEAVALEIKSDKEEYSKRDNIKLHIKAAGTDGGPVASVLNVAVEDESIQRLSDTMEFTMPPASNEFFESWLARYQTKYSADDIDLLLVTRKSILSQSFDTSFGQAVDKYDDNKILQSVIGKIANKKGNGISDLIVTAIAKNTNNFFIDIDTTDKNGTFNLSIPSNFDSLQFSLQVTDKHGTPALSDSMKLESFEYPFFHTPALLKQESFTDNINMLSIIQKYHADTGITLEDKNALTPVIVKTVKKAEINYDASKRINSISQILTSDKFRYGGKDAIGNAILTVPGVSLLMGDITIFGPNVNMQGRIGRPLVIIDGYSCPTENVLEFLNSLSPADIDFIEVLRGAEAALYGSRGAYGVISINTKHGPDKTINDKSNLRVFRPVTYHVSPKFKMPDYSDKQLKESPFPDQRATIYWNGNIITDANGQANINFYAADKPSNYVITVTGISENGDFFINVFQLRSLKKPIEFIRIILNDVFSPGSLSTQTRFLDSLRTVYESNSFGRR
jgi:TonB-dependent SusC/RagA subfamily outer membrane receptor